MTIKELRRLNPEELEKLLKENRQKLRVLRFDFSFGKVNAKEIKALKKQIARIITLLEEIKK